MAKDFRGQPPVRVFSTPSRGLIDLLETILVELDAQQTVGEAFSQERLAELGAQFNLADRDWGQLYCLIRRLKK